MNIVYCFILAVVGASSLLVILFSNNFVNILYMLIRLCENLDNIKIHRGDSSHVEQRKFSTR